MKLKIKNLYSQSVNLPGFRQLKSFDILERAEIV